MPMTRDGAAVEVYCGLYSAIDAGGCGSRDLPVGYIVPMTRDGAAVVCYLRAI